MFINTRSILLPIEKNVNFYEEFVLQYSMIVSSNTLLFTLIEKSDNNELFEILQSFHGLIDDYETVQVFLMGAGYKYEAPQLEESRGLILDSLFNEIFSKKELCQGTIRQILNMQQILLLYGTFEGVLKKHFFEIGILSEGKYFREKELMTFVKEKIDHSGNSDKFNEYLLERHGIKSFDLLLKLWDFFTHIRHLYVHSGGKVTKKWLDSFLHHKKLVVDNIYNSYIFASKFFYYIDKFEEEIPIENKIFLPSDQLTNLFFEFIVSVMECLYLIED